MSMVQPATDALNITDVLFKCETERGKKWTGGARSHQIQTAPGFTNTLTTIQSLQIQPET